MTEAPGSHGEQHVGPSRGTRAQHRQWGLLVEDEVKSDAAFMVQDAFRSLVASLFYLLPSLTHDIVVKGREHVSDYRPKIFISNHKRDLDSLVVVAACYFVQGALRPDRHLVFGLREDVSWPGFLGRYVSAPWPLKPLLGRLDLGPITKMLKAYPVGRISQREDSRRMLRQLRQFSNLLDRGRSVYWTPEGGLSLDGSLGEFRAGLFRIIRDSSARPRLAPVAICYDFLTSGRTRCFVRFGPEFEVDRSAGRRAIEQRAREAIASEITLNLGHLMVELLRDAPPGHAAAWTADQLVTALLAQAGRHLRAGHHLDSRLTEVSALRRRLRGFLTYADRQGILRRTEEGWLVTGGLDHPGMRYAQRELASVQSS